MEYYLFSCKYLNEIKSVILRNAIKNPLIIRAEKTFIQNFVKRGVRSVTQINFCSIDSAHLIGNKISHY